METIKNAELTLSVSQKGAEIQSVILNKSGKEYWWQGDSKWWGGRAPILFPICGGMWDGTCTYKDQTLKIEKHGFVRKAEWTLAAQSENSVTYSYEPTAEELVSYPFPCRVEVTYALEGMQLRMTMRVINLGTEEMYFQMGGHPAFNLPDFSEDKDVVAYVRLEGTPESVLRASTQGCTEHERFSFPQTEEGLVPVCVATFNNEALIFDKHQLKAATLLNLNKQPIARVECSAPVWLFWQPQGVPTPFLCIEPWYGLCDEQGFNGSIQERPYMQALEAGKTWENDLVIQFYE